MKSAIDGTSCYNGIKTDSHFRICQQDVTAMSGPRRLNSTDSHYKDTWQQRCLNWINVAYPLPCLQVWIKFKHTETTVVIMGITIRLAVEKDYKSVVNKGTHCKY